MSAVALHSKRKWYPVLVIGFSLLFFAAFGGFVFYVFVRGVFFKHYEPNWGIFGFGAAMLVFAVYLFLIWIPNLTTLTITGEMISEASWTGRKHIPLKDIRSLNLDDEKEVKALGIQTIASCATICSAEHTITFMYGNYTNADEVRKALEKIALHKF